MSLTIQCDKCKFENELGRVFCARCGIRLDSTKITAEALLASSRPKAGAGIRKAAVSLVPIVILCLVGLAFWPVAIEGDKGTKSAGRALQKQLMAFQTGLLTANRLGTTFSERSINGYFDMVNEKSGIEVVASLGTNTFDCVARRTMGPLVIGEFETPTISLAYTLHGKAEDNHLVLSGGAVGHIPLPGPLKYLAASQIKKRVVTGEKYEELFEKVAEIVIRDGAVEIAFGR